MILPTEPTYGVFLRTTQEPDNRTAGLLYLPVVGYAREGQELTPHFLAHGSAQSWSVFSLPDYAPYKEHRIIFLGVLMPNALIPEVNEQQMDAIIANAQYHLQHDPDVVLEVDLREWLGDLNG